MSTGQLAGGVAGGIAGALLIGSGVGIAGGVIIGALLGSLSSGQKMVMEYGKLADRKWQGSEFGSDIARCYGTYGISGGYVPWLEHNELKETIKKKKSGGKGFGGGTEAEYYSYFATFILTLKEGRSKAVRRIWCQDKLIYNAGSDDLETIIASNQSAKGWKFYDGRDDQLPDPRYEAEYGVGNVPAFRGFSYIAFYDFPLKDYGNTLQIANFKIELMSEADSEIEVHYADRIPNYPSANNPNWNGQVSFFDGESTLAYVGQWDNTYGSSNVDVYRIIAGNSVKLRTMIAPSNRPFLVGLSDENGYMNGQGGTYYYWSETDQISYSISTVDYGSSDGVFVKFDRSLVLGSSNTADRKLRLFDLFSSTAQGLLAETSVDLGYYVSALSYYSGRIYALAANDNRVLILDEDLDLVDQFTFPGAIGVTSSSRLYVDSDGQAYVLTGQGVYKVSSGSSELVWALPSGYGPSLSNLLVSEGLIACWNLSTSAERPYRLIYLASTVSPGITTLAEIVTAECELSGLLTAADLDVSMLAQDVYGYSVSGGSIRASLESLQSAFPFDVRQHGYKLQFVPRGQSSVVTIPWEHLAATDGDDLGDTLPYSREMDSQLPLKINITAISSEREYGSTTQSSAGRPDTDAVNEEDLTLNVVLSDDQVAQIADALEQVRWMERRDYEVSLPPLYLGLEPADVITVQAKFGEFELRIGEADYGANGLVNLKAKENRAPAYSSQAVGAPSPAPDGTIPLRGPSLSLELDIPVVDETVQNVPGFVAVMAGFTEGWTSGVLVQSANAGQTWTELQAFAGKGTFGRVSGALPASNCTVIDQRSITITLMAGELESVTRDQMLAGVNYAAYGVDGRWEIVRFQNAVLQSDGSYLVSGFVRGQRGTEWATGLHAADDWFVLLDDPDNIFISQAIESIGQARTYRAVTAGATIDSATDQAFTYRGVNLECLSPVYARGSRDGSSNFSGTFTRRSRLSNTWWTNGVVAPVGEASEAYEIDVMSGSTVKRTISVTSPAWSYSATEQTTDFGSAQSSITFRLYQLSDKVGRGYPLEVTL